MSRLLIIGCGGVAAVAQSHLVHGEQNAALHRFLTIHHIRQGAAFDHRQCIFQIGALSVCRQRGAIVIGHCEHWLCRRHHRRSSRFTQGILVFIFGRGNLFIIHGAYFTFTRHPNRTMGKKSCHGDTSPICQRLICRNGKHQWIHPICHVAANLCMVLSSPFPTFFAPFSFHTSKTEHCTFRLRSIVYSYCGIRLEEFESCPKWKNNNS